VQSNTLHSALKAHLDTGKYVTAKKLFIKCKSWEGKGRICRMGMVLSGWDQQNITRGKKEQLKALSEN
jgi:hypothetical protein